MRMGADWKAFAETKDLKLSILEPESTQQGGMVTLCRGTAGTAQYRVILQPCWKPRCGCGGIYFECQPAMPESAAIQPGGMRKFWLDVHERKATSSPEVKMDDASSRLANDIQASLTGEDWQR